MRPKIIMLDWDGTMVDMFKQTYQAMNETLLAMGQQPWDEATAHALCGRPDDVQFPELFGERAGEALVIYRAAHKRMSQESSASLLPGAQEFVAFLSQLQREGKIHLGVISNKPSALIHEEIHQFGWDGVFNSVTGSGDAAQNKPSPAALAKGLKNYKGTYRPSEVLYVGDTNTDREFARNTGAKFIGVGDKISPPIEPGEHCADLSQALARMERLFQRSMPSPHDKRAI